MVGVFPSPGRPELSSLFPARFRCFAWTFIGFCPAFSGYPPPRAARRRLGGQAPARPAEGSGRIDQGESFRENPYPAGRAPEMIPKVLKDKVDIVIWDRVSFPPWPREIRPVRSGRNGAALKGGENHGREAGIPQPYGASELLYRARAPGLKTDAAPKEGRRT